MRFMKKWGQEATAWRRGGVAAWRRGGVAGSDLVWAILAMNMGANLSSLAQQRPLPYSGKE
jgi:hypothetical protein